MNKPRASFDQRDQRITAHMAGCGITLLHLTVGRVFLWFGFLKCIPGLRPAEELATRTMHVLSFGLVPPRAALIALAVWQCAVGLGLIFGVFLRAPLLLLWLQMAGTVTAVFIFPQEVFTRRRSKDNTASKILSWRVPPSSSAPPSAAAA